MDDKAWAVKCISRQGSWSNQTFIVDAQISNARNVPHLPPEGILSTASEGSFFGRVRWSEVGGGS